MGMTPTRRTVLSRGVAGVGGVILGTGVAAADTVTFEGTILSNDEQPVADARVAVSTRNKFEYVWTGDDGYFSTTVEPGQNLSPGFYKSNESGALLAPRLDGVPHIYTLPKVYVDDAGYDLGEYTLPEASLFEARAVFAGKPGGVADAIPRFMSKRSGAAFGSGYSATTTNEDGYMKLKAADFTGVEMAEETRLYMYAPTFVPYEEQDEEDYAPYEKVDITDLTITDDTTIESDISRKKEKH